MKRTPIHDVVIIGAYNTRQARVLSGETSDTITIGAVRGALEDAGLKPGDIDGLVVKSGAGVVSQSARMARVLGAKPRWTGGELLGIPAVLEAAAAIAAGYCHTVVVATGQAGEFTERGGTAPWTRPSNEFVECWGLHTAVEFALIAQRHMHVYGTRPEHLAEVAATIRNNAYINPNAVYYGRGPYTPEDILRSRMITEPFHLLDCSTTSEGGAGLVLTTIDRARDCPAQPIFLLGGALDSRGVAYTMAPIFDEVGWVGRWAAEKAFAMAGCRPKDVDVCEFYDPYSFEIIRQFEAFGFCPEGEGGPFVMNGRIGIGGEFPVCTDGGTMAFSHPGFAQTHQKIIAAVQQLRGRAGSRQVADAQIAMVSNGGAGALFCHVLLLGKEPA